MFESALPAGFEEALLKRDAAHPFEGLLLLDALALFRDGNLESGMRCLEKLQESSNLHALVDLLCPGFALQHDRRAQRIRRAILNPGNVQGVFGSRAPASNDPSPKPEARALPQELTPKQRVVLGLVRDGLTNKQIARRLLVSENTVKWHLKMLSRQLGAGNRCSTVCIAEQRRLIPPLGEVAGTAQ